MMWNFNQGLAAVVLAWVVLGKQCTSYSAMQEVRNILHKAHLYESLRQKSVFLYDRSIMEHFSKLRDIA